MANLRALYAASERVPGPTAAGMRMSQLVLSFCTQLEADGLSLKSEDLAHIQRLGTARMMRVPAPEAGFVERVSAFQRALKRQVEGDGYDLVHAADAWAGAVAAQHKETAPDLKVITELAELPSQSLGERWPELQLEERLRQIVRRGETLVLQRSDLLVVPSVPAQKALVAAGAPAERVVVVPPGVDEQVFFASSVEVKLADGRFNVLYAGAPDVKRGLPVFLSALKAMPAGVMGTLLRHRPREPEAEDAVAAAGLTDRVAWHDATTPQKLAQAFQGVDVVVLLPLLVPSTVHAGHVPRRLVEAMACRRAVIVSDTPGVREVARDGQNALVVARDAKALKDAMVALFNDSALRNRLGQRAAETAGTHGWNGRLTAYRKMYQQLLPAHAFLVEEPRSARAGGLAERLKAQKAPAVNAGRTVVRDEKAARPSTGNPAPPVGQVPGAPLAAPPVTPAPSAAAKNAPPNAPPAASSAAAGPVVTRSTTPPSLPAPPSPAPLQRTPTHPGLLMHAVPTPSPLPVIRGVPDSLSVTLPEMPVVVGSSGGLQAPMGGATDPSIQTLDVSGAMPPVVLPPAMSLPEDSPFGRPMSAAGAVPTLPIQMTPPAHPAAFLTEPTPAHGMPSERTPASPYGGEASDEWQGDTVAVTDIPLHQDSNPPQPLARAPRQDAAEGLPKQAAGSGAAPLPPPAPRSEADAAAHAMRGPVGMRSLALLDSLPGDGQVPSRSRAPGASDETERLDLTSANTAELYASLATRLGKPAADNSNPPAHPAQADSKAEDNNAPPHLVEPTPSG